MSNSLSITLKGSSVGLSDLMNALRHFSTVLDEVDQQITGQRSMEWKLTKLHYSSAAVEVTPVPRQNDLFDQRAEVVAACASGIERLVERADRPPYFSDRALVSARSLAKLNRGDVTGVMLETALDNRPPARVLLGATIVEHVDEILGLSRHATGALEGRLETITIHDRNAFTIYDPLRSYGTRCICDAETLNVAHRYLGRRVLVYGEIGYNKDGEPSTIRVERFETLRPRDELPQSEDIRGLYVDSKTLDGGHADYLRGR